MTTAVLFKMNANYTSPSSQWSDESLIARVTRGDRGALETLYDQHAPTVMAISLRITGDPLIAEEVLQETFWRVWTRAGGYQPGRGLFRSWLFQIARNLAIDAYRQQARRPQEFVQSAEEASQLDHLPDPDTDTAERAESNLNSYLVRSALAELPAAQQQVIEMVYFQGMTRQEIAEATGESLGTIHTRARLGLQKLRVALRRESHLATETE